MTDRLIDSSFRLISDLVIDLQPAKQARIALSEVEIDLRRSFDWPRNQLIEAEQATPILHNIRLQLEQYLISHSGFYSKHKWLWFLRRMPEALFSGEFLTTSPYSRFFAETIATIAAKEDSEAYIEPESGITSFPINSSVVRRILRFYLVSRLLADIHVDLRWAGKGASFRFGHSGFPIPQPTTELRQSVHLYDLRTAAEGPEFSTLGTVSGSHATRGKLNICAAWRQEEPEWIELPLFLTHDRAIENYSYYGVSLIDLDEVVKFISDELTEEADLWNEVVAALISVLHMTYLELTTSVAQLRAILTTGYFLMEMETFLKHCEDFLSSFERVKNSFGIRGALPQSGTELIKILSDSAGTPWPFRPGPLVVKTPIGILINVATATQRLYKELEFPQTAGQIANIRSRHFEKAIQSRVNISDWCPSEEILRYSGKTLRINGQSITDIDAIAERGETLLLISCKSIPYTNLYDGGDFRAVRNATTTGLDAISKWRDVMRTVSTTPKGDNYDFRSYSKICGVVCTPHIIFFPLGIATSEVLPGLRACVSAAELTKWLSKKEKAE